MGLHHPDQNDEWMCAVSFKDVVWLECRIREASVIYILVYYYIYNNSISRLNLKLSYIIVCLRAISKHPFKHQLVFTRSPLC